MKKELYDQAFKEWLIKYSYLEFDRYEYDEVYVDLTLFYKDDNEPFGEFEFVKGSRTRIAFSELADRFFEIQFNNSLPFSL
jgi:hypothetical protein